MSPRLLRFKDATSYKLTVPLVQESFGVADLFKILRRVGRRITFCGSEGCIAMTRLDQVRCADKSRAALPAWLILNKKTALLGLPLCPNDKKRRAMQTQCRRIPH